MHSDPVFEAVFSQASANSWHDLSNARKAELYNLWTDDADIGGVLRARGYDPVRVRVYIKDTIIGQYNKSRKIQLPDVLNVHGYGPLVSVEHKYNKPEAILDATGLYTITEARAWKVATVNSWLRFRESGCSGVNVLFITQWRGSELFQNSTRKSAFESLCEILALKYIFVN